MLIWKSREKLQLRKDAKFLILEISSFGELVQKTSNIRNFELSNIGKFEKKSS